LAVYDWAARLFPAALMLESFLVATRTIAPRWWGLVRQILNESFSADPFALLAEAAFRVFAPRAPGRNGLAAASRSSKQTVLLFGEFVAYSPQFFGLVT